MTESNFSWQNWWHKQAESLRIVAISLLVAGILRFFVVEPRFIPSGSMEPTLMVNDRIMVEKLSYRWRHPQRGEIVVFYPPFEAESGLPGKAYIKRVIGLPGEVIRIDEGKVYINEAPLSESYILKPPVYQMSAYTIPSGYYWVMGDNRNNSNDSHVWGFLPEENIVGRAFLRFWPADQRVGILGIPQYPELPAAQPA